MSTPLSRAALTARLTIACTGGARARAKDHLAGCRHAQDPQAHDRRRSAGRARLVAACGGDDGDNTASGDSSTGGLTSAAAEPAAAEVQTLEAVVPGGEGGEPDVAGDGAPHVGHGMLSQASIS
jgi:hypothetical protein